jgi:DNA-binding transcriptional LysR family regulator
MRATEFAELAAFVAVAEERSFRKAATRLNLRPSTLSHTLTALEERLGVRLLNRTTRTVAPSAAGAALLSQIAPLLGALRAAVDDMNAFRATPLGSVRLNVPQTAATVVLGPKLADFSVAYPDLLLEVTVDDCFVDIVRDGFDAGIRLAADIEQDMVAVRVSRGLRAAVVASPGYWQERELPVRPRDLRDHRCISRSCQL